MESDAASERTSRQRRLTALQAALVLAGPDLGFLGGAVLEPRRDPPLDPGGTDMDVRPPLPPQAPPGPGRRKAKARAKAKKAARKRQKAARRKNR